MPFPLVHSSAFFLPLEVYSLLALIAQSRQESSCLPSLCTRAFMTSIGRGHQMCLIWQMKCVSSTQSLKGQFLKVKSTKKVSFGGNNLIQKMLGNKTYEMCIFCPTYVKAEGSLLDWSKPFHPPFDFLARCFLKLPPDPKAKHRKIIADVLSYPL